MVNRTYRFPVKLHLKPIPFQVRNKGNDSLSADLSGEHLRKLVAIGVGFESSKESALH